MADSIGPLAAASVFWGSGIGGREDTSTIDEIIAIVARGALASHIRITIAKLRNLGANVVLGKDPSWRAFSARVGRPVPDLAAGVGERSGV